MNFFGMIDRFLSNRVVRFFYPKAMPGDVVSQIYVRTFRWTFFLILPMAFVAYLVLGTDSAYVQGFLDMDSYLTAFMAGRQYQKIPHFQVHGFFMLVFIIVALFFFAKDMKKIPPDVCDLGTPTCYLMNLTYVLFLPAGFLVVKIGDVLEKNPVITAQNIWLLVLFSYVYGWIAVNFIRFLLVVSLISGWRMTNRSFFNREYRARRKSQNLRRKQCPPRECGDRL